MRRQTPEEGLVRGLRWCPFDEQLVAPVRPPFRWRAFLVLSLLTLGVGGFVYALGWRARARRGRCPLCWTPWLAPARHAPRAPRTAPLPRRRSA